MLNGTAVSNEGQAMNLLTPLPPSSTKVPEPFFVGCHHLFVHERKLKTVHLSSAVHVKQSILTSSLEICTSAHSEVVYFNQGWLVCCTFDVQKYPLYIVVVFLFMYVCIY